VTRKYAPEAVAASVVFIVLFFIILWQVFGRTPLMTGPVWTEELARWLWVWMALIGIGAVERNASHLRMSFLTGLLPRVVQRGLQILTDLIYIGLASHLIWIAWKSVKRTWNYEAVSLPATDAVLYASAFVAMILIVLRVAQRLLSSATGFPSNQTDDSTP
jgi:TRAP-type C4-dicarboxylate transport system permease small subunit